MTKVQKETLQIYIIFKLKSFSCSNIANSNAEKASLDIQNTMLVYKITVIVINGLKT